MNVMADAEGDARRVRELVRRPASLARLHREAEATGWGSWIADVRMIGAGEVWPESAGRPLAPVCQISLDELPHRPPRLEDVGWLSLFMATDPAGEFVLPNSTPNGEGWALRAYPRDGDLVAVPDPPVRSRVQPASLAWSQIEEDFPDWEDAWGTLDGTAHEGDFLWYGEHVGQAAEGIKVGGWPSLVQSEICWAPFNRHPANPDYVLQIDSLPELGLYWGHQGVLYVGRGDAAHSDVWTLEWQCL